MPATDIQYEGHIERRKNRQEKITRMESKIIPADIVTNAFTP